MAYVLLLVCGVSLALALSAGLIVDQESVQMAATQRKTLGLREERFLGLLLTELRALRRDAIRTGAVVTRDRLQVERAYTRFRDHASHEGYEFRLEKPIARFEAAWADVPDTGSASAQIDRTIVQALDLTRIVDERSTLRSENDDATSSLVDALVIELPIVEDRADQESDLVSAAYRSGRNLAGAAFGVSIFSVQGERAYAHAVSEVRRAAAFEETAGDARDAVNAVGTPLLAFSDRIRAASRGSLRNSRDPGPFARARDELARTIAVADTNLDEAIAIQLRSRLTNQSTFIFRVRLAAVIAILAVIVIGLWLGSSLAHRDRRELAAARAEIERVRIRDSLALVEARFEAVFDRSEIGIAIVDLSGNIVRSNVTLAHMLDDLSATHLGVEGEAFARLATGAVDAYEVATVVPRDDRVMHVESNVSLVRSDAGAPMFGVALVRDVTERNIREELERFEARHDRLVGLLNRNGFIEHVRAVAFVYRERETRSALVLVTLEHLDGIVDSLGLRTGDRVLKETATRLHACIGPSDVLARLGAGEFAIFFGNATVAADPSALAERVIAALAPPYSIDGRELVVEPRAGVVPLDSAHATVDELLEDAGHVLKVARRESARFALFEPAMRDAARRRLLVLEHLVRAVERDLFRVVFQPIVALSNGYPVACEVLIRWTSPELGEMSPSEFVPVAEESGLIVPIGRHVFDRACEQLATWRRTNKRFTKTYISINTSPQQLLQSDFVAFVEETIERHGLRPRDVVLEITEGIVLTNNAVTRTALERFKAAGIRLSIDDFGTGYSSLRYLKAFPFDFLKIDASFVRGKENSLASEPIVAMILALGESCGVTVVAEGVETALQAAQLQRLGCQFAQGYLFGRPAAADEIVEAFDTNARILASR